MDSTDKAGVNRQYKDRLFKFIFGNPENKDWTLSLYNAINGTSYDDPNEIYFTTIETALYMKMRNDVSVLVENIMNLWEQESSYNPNLPMRFFIYSGMVYSKFVEESDYNILTAVAKLTIDFEIKFRQTRKKSAGLLVASQG